MHIITGLAIAALLGRNKRTPASLPSVFGVLEIVHSMPNRLRMASPKLENAPAEVVNAFTDQLGTIPGVQSVAVTPISGSVLVHFDERVVTPDIIHGVVVRLLGLEQDLEAPPQGKLMKELKELTTYVSHQVHQSSGGLMDLRTSVILSLVSMALYRILILKDRAMPSGITLLWWASILASRKG